MSIHHLGESYQSSMLSILSPIWESANLVLFCANDRILKDRQAGSEPSRHQRA